MGNRDGSDRVGSEKNGCMDNSATASAVALYSKGCSRSVDVICSWISANKNTSNLAGYVAEMQILYDNDFGLKQESVKCRYMYFTELK